jgi:microcystin degradation protein MlrC
VGPAAAAGAGRRPRIAVAKLQQETNDLSPIPTTRADFEALGFYRGADVFIEGKGLEGSVEGFMAGSAAWKTPPEVVGIAHTAAWAIGRLTKDCWAWLLEEYLGAIAAAVADGGLDGANTAFFEPCYAKNDHFAKPGSDTHRKSWYTKAFIAGIYMILHGAMVVDGAKNAYLLRHLILT